MKKEDPERGILTEEPFVHKMLSMKQTSVHFEFLQSFSLLLTARKGVGREEIPSLFHSLLHLVLQSFTEVVWTRLPELAEFYVSGGREKQIYLYSHSLSLAVLLVL